MKGKRRYPDENNNLKLGNGDYGRIGEIWYCRPPGCHTGSLERHEVTEHEDGTITVSPSILLDEGDKQWHGYLEKGIWRQV